MPKIQWERLPREKWAHLRDRAKEREISENDLFALAEWKAEDPDVPDGDWYKDFGKFQALRQRPPARTFLQRGQAARGKRLQPPAVGEAAFHRLKCVLPLMVVSDVREDSVEIFCSYAHEDEPLRQEFETSVALMRRKKQIEVWHDRQIMAGERWRDDLDEHLNSADIITLFVSRDFLASDYCYEKELTRALEREAAKDAVVVPIIVRDCDWSDAPFRYLQGIPSGKAVTSWANRDEAWTAVAKALKLIVLDLLKKKKEKAEALAAAVPPPPVQASAPARLLPMEEALDRQRAQEIYAGILKDAAQGQMERWRVVQELQTKIFSLEQDLGGSGLPRPKKRASDAYNAMDAYIRDLDK